MRSLKLRDLWSCTDKENNGESSMDNVFGEIIYFSANIKVIDIV